MGKNIIEKIMEAHKISGTLEPGSEVALTIDHTLIQDATGTMALLQFETIGVSRTGDDLSVCNYQIVHLCPILPWPQVTLTNLLLESSRKLIGASAMSS